VDFSKKFLSKFGLTQQILSTQVNSYDTLAESYQTVSRVNTILTDLSRDMWLYISRGIFAQETQEGEVGSSTMPHKINPIDFENAEGNLGIANSYLNHLASTLPISRLQRDLSGSTVIRNQGIPLAHSLLACKSLIKGLGKISPSFEKLYDELNEHWELLTEPIQTMLRKYGQSNAYEQLKKMSRGNKITRAQLVDYIQTLPIPNEAKRDLLALSPYTYIGLSTKLANLE
jgi:adenylosuccinate lyase